MIDIFEVHDLQTGTTSTDGLEPPLAGDGGVITDVLPLCRVEGVGKEEEVLRGVDAEENQPEHDGLPLVKKKVGYRSWVPQDVRTALLVEMEEVGKAVHERDDGAERYWDHGIAGEDDDGEEHVDAGLVAWR